MDNLDNMKKTVLKLEKEISAISMNLSKVQKKEHSKMQNIIQNINNLLNKESKQNNIHLNKMDKYNNDVKNKEKMNDNKNNKTIQCFHTKNKNNIDCILISLKQAKDKNKDEFNETFFNKKKRASSKIFINNNKHYLTSDEKLLRANKTELENFKKSDLIKKQKNKYIGKSRNNNNYLYNQMTYTKPKLNNELSKRNINKKKNRTNSSNNQIINNIFDINNKINTIIQIGGKNNSISNLKNLSVRTKIRQNEIGQNKNIENFNKNKIFSINKSKHEEKNFRKELLYDKKMLQIDDLEIKDNSQNNENSEEYKQLSIKDLSIIKNKNLVFNLKSDINKACNHNKESKIIPLFKQTKYINTYRNNLINENNNKIRHPYLINNEENKNSIKSFERINTKMNDEDIYLETIHNQRSKIINIQKRNYSKDDKIKRENKMEEDNIKLIKLLNMLKVNDINEAVSKVAKLIKMQKYVNKCKQLFDDINNNNKNDSQYNKLSDDIRNQNFHWISDMIKNYKENQIYKNFCGAIMTANKIKHFEDFKKFINNILINNQKNKGFFVEVKNILCKDDYYNSKNNKGKNNINFNYGNLINAKKRKNNKKVHDLENSNDIKFSRNDDNLQIKEDKLKTYYY